MDGVNLLQVDADDDGFEGRFDFDFYRPLTASGDALITKITAELSEQENGPETTRIIASVGLEDKPDTDIVTGRFVHFTKETSDYATSYTGSQDSAGVSIGMYRIYSPRVNQLMSIYGSAGLVNTDLSLKKNDIQINADYMSYNFQGGVSVSRTVKSQRLLRIYEFAVDGLYNYQNGHTASFSNGLSKFDRLVAGKAYHEITGSFAPKFIYSLGRDKAGGESLLTFNTRLKCGTGSLSTSCGGGLGLNVTRPFKKGDGFSTFGFNYERYRKTDTYSYFLDLNKQLGHEHISVDTRLNHNRILSPVMRKPVDTGISSTLRMRF